MSSDRSRPAGPPIGVNPGELAVDVIAEDGRYDVYLRGELDMSTAGRLREELERLSANQAPHIVVDLSSLAFVDSTGLSVLITGLKHLRAQGGDMSLRSPNPGTRRVLEITGLTEVFAIS